MVGFSKNLSISIQIFYSLFGLRTKQIFTCNTTSTTPVSLHRNGLGMLPVRSPLLGESLTCFLFLRVLRWFTSPGSLPIPMNSVKDDQDLPDRVAPFGYLRVKACSRLTVSFSQPATSFIASECQGIHRMLLVA